MKAGRRVAVLRAACLAAAVPAAADAQRSKTPEAKSFEVRVDDAEQLIVWIVETVPGTDEGVGFTVRCIRMSDGPEGTPAFGFFPRGKRVQAAVKPSKGKVERFVLSWSAGSPPDFMCRCWRDGRTWSG